MERAKQEDLIRRAKAKNALPPNPSTQITSERKLVAGETKGREEGQQNPRFENLGKIKTGSNTLKSGDVKVKIHLRDINVSLSSIFPRDAAERESAELRPFFPVILLSLSEQLFQSSDPQQTL